MRFQDEVEVQDPDPSSLVTDPWPLPTSGPTGFNIVSDHTYYLVNKPIVMLNEWVVTGQ